MELDDITPVFASQLGSDGHLLAVFHHLPLLFVVFCLKFGFGIRWVLLGLGGF